MSFIRFALLPWAVCLLFPLEPLLAGQEVAAGEVLQAEAAPSGGAPAAIATLAARIREAGLDPAECYRVRDLDLTREDARIYLTDGYLVFGKEVNGKRFSAIFAGETDGGDAEILLFPPSRAERMSLAKFTGSPNLNEHFRTAAFLFTDDTYREVVRQVEEKEAGRKVPDIGVLYAEKYDGLIRNLSESVELRLTRDLMGGEAARHGFFYATLDGNRLGNFDFVLDPASSTGIRVGQFSVRSEPVFDTWTQFQSRGSAGGQSAARSLDYRVEHYDLDATLERDLSLKVRTRLRLTPEKPLAAITLLISHNMKILAARSGEEALEVYRPRAMRINSIRHDQDTEFLVSLPKGAVPGRPVVIEILHEGKVVRDSGNGVLFVGARGSWFPGLGNRLATYDVTFRAPKGMEFVSTHETLEQSSDAGATTFHASVKTPVRTFGFNVGAYKRATARKDGFVVNVYANKHVETALEPRGRVWIGPVPGATPRRRGVPDFPVTSVPPPPPDPTRNLANFSVEVAEMLSRMSELFGPPVLNTVNVSPIPGHFGQGFAGMIYLSTISYLPESQRPEHARDVANRTFYSNLLLPHELAHQWWGNLVYCDSEQDTWLMEGLATYTALIMLEREKGRKELTNVLLRYRDNLLAGLGDGRIVDDAGPILWGERLINSRDRGSWNTITYEKGAWIFHMLRARLGDDAFFRMLGELPRRFAAKPLSTAAFRQFAAEFTSAKSPDADLEEFFAEWVESTGIPRIELNAAIQARASKAIVKGTVTQSLVSKEFGAMVPVVIRFPRGPAETRWVHTSDGEEEFEWTFPSMPSRVELDPDWSTLRRE